LYRVVPLFLFILILTISSVPAQAGIVVTVNKSAQRLTVAVDGSERYTWPVSTGRWGYSTPNGSYRPQRLERKWFSRKYDMSPMPYSIFFNEGYAIHGSYEVSRLGRPASHGCIRLSPSNAAVLFALVKDRTDDTRIVVTGEAPAQRARAREDGWQTEPTQYNENNFNNSWDNNRSRSYWQWR
jgi:lipoprotein-anchoring transpeptidase ErfK/SrfK